MYLPELLAPVWKIKGTGGKTGKTAERLGNLGIFTAQDILLHLPRDYEDRTRRIPFAAAPQNGGKFNTTAYVESHESFYFRGRQTLKLILRDESAQAELPLYGWDPSSNVSKYSPGTRLDMAGTLSVSYGRLQCARADMEAAGTRPELFSAVLPIYNLTAGIAQKTMRRIIRSACAEFASHLEDEIPAAVREAQNILPV
ncbi:MAG: hypothetical protein LBT68_07775, partial [Spirochaetales bacterium]|nr:hypothetical protein [Spirochaetales bacterium]